jgi:broad specificity phosphatase PhoE
MPFPIRTERSLLMRSRTGTLKIHVVRHGPSPYRQPEWHDIATAYDLNALGRYDETSLSATEIREGERQAVELVERTALVIAADIKPGEEIAIWASPTGRTLNTARIISRIFRSRGLRPRKGEYGARHGIKIFACLGEIKNFSWAMFEPLVKGGEVTHSGKTFYVDKALSNPKGLGYLWYFRQDAIKDIAPEAKSTWPAEYVAWIESFESCVEATGRIMGALSRLKRIKDRNYRVILVTHDGLVGSLVKTFTSGRLESLDTAQQIRLERRDGRLVVTQVGDITEGDETKDVIEDSVR